MTSQKVTLREILDKLREYIFKTHRLFVFVKAAYDLVKRNELWFVMLAHGFPTKLV